METQAPASNHPARILIVDDHPNTAAMLARVLSTLDASMEILVTGSGEEALEIINRSPVDILITDFMMSGMTGLDLVGKLTGEREPAHKILVTAYDTPGLAVIARQLKIQDFLLKPVQPDKIREIITRVLRQIRQDTSLANPLEKKQCKILIADDYPDNVRLLAARLKSEGYAFITAENGAETLEKARTEQPDLILLDVNMPQKDGFQVLAEIRSDPCIAHIQVILITAARFTINEIREGLNLGADDYVTKPVDWRELSARIQTKLRVKLVEDQLRARNRQLEAIPVISQGLKSISDLPTLAHTILERTTSTFSATGGWLVLPHEINADRLFTFPIQDVSKLESDDLAQGIITHRQVEQVIQEQKGIIVEDCTQEADWPTHENTVYRSALILPLMGRQDVCAVLGLVHPQTGYFNQEHLALAKGFADQVALPIENLQLQAAEKRRVNLMIGLNQLIREISTVSQTQELIARLPEWICKALEYPAAAIWSIRNNDPVLLAIAGAGRAVNQPWLDYGPQKVVNEQHAVLLTDPNNTKDSHTVPGQSVIAAPLYCNGELMGILSIHSLHPRAFENNDLLLIDTLSTLVSSQIERLAPAESILFSPAPTQVGTGLA